MSEISEITKKAIEESKLMRRKVEKLLGKAIQLVSKENICVPVDQRGLNEVDLLVNKTKSIQKKIKSIQEKCSHEWRLVTPIYLRESLVKGVFILYDASRKSYNEWNTVGVLKCLKCSAEKSLNIDETCPRCLGKTKEDIREGMREFYFAEPHVYYGAFPRCCTECGLKVVVDIWDP